MKPHKTLKIGKKYKITYPNGESTIGKLIKIEKLLSTHLFEYTSGNNILVTDIHDSDYHKEHPNTFHFPKFVLDKLEIKEI